jgi:hypothetical protein
MTNWHRGRLGILGTKATPKDGHDPIPNKKVLFCPFKDGKINYKDSKVNLKNGQQLKSESPRAFRWRQNTFPF